MTTPHRLLLVAASLAGIAISAPASAETVIPRAVAELFTSQGCSSCPPADKVWNDLATRDDVLALTLPVDYWDYLGWKDTLAKPSHTQRQRGYARSLHARSIYTPQSVINGEIDVVGSRRGEVLNAIDRGTLLDAGIGLDISANGGKITVSAKARGAGTEAGTVWLVVFQPAETVAIGRGENAGRTVVYSNIVRDLRPLGKWNGKSTTYQARLGNLAGTNLRCAVIVQGEDNGAPGPIRAAAVLREAM